MTKTNIPPEPVRVGYSGTRGGFYIEMSDGTVRVFQSTEERGRALQAAYKAVNRAVILEAAMRNMD